jgi:hypothetical protein
MTNPSQKLDTGRSKAGWSYYGSWRKCPRKWAYENVYAVEGSRGGARGLGTLVHELLAAHYLARMGKAAPSIESILADKGAHLKTEAVELAKDRYAKYVAAYATEDWTPIAVEEEFRIGFLLGPDGVVRTVDAGTPGSVLYTSRVDLVVRDGQGKIWIVDHKTAARVSGASEFRYAMHGQFHGFWHIGQHFYGADFAGPMINFIQTWSGTHFKRVRPPAAPAFVEGFPRLIVATASEIALWSKQVTQPSDWPVSSNETVCVSTYGTCDHAIRCRFGE